jgi:hypothetical protein
MKLFSENLAQELASFKVFPAEITPLIVAASTIESEISCEMDDVLEICTSRDLVSPCLTINHTRLFAPMAS